MKQSSNILVIGLLLFFIWFFHFYKLDALPCRVWDEARLATSAYEMSKTGDWIVTTLNYKPDIIGTKPPLMIWTQAICIKLMGLSEWSIRLPAAVCAVFTILIVFAFVYYITKSKWSALTSAIVLCTANGYLFDHASRNGEYDSMLALFTTCALLSLFLYTELTGEKRNRWLLWFFIYLTIAALTKGVAAMLFCPAIFIYIVWRRQLISTVLNKYFIAGVVLFLIMVGSFYVLREIRGPGYLQAVATQELGGRFNTVIEQHQGPWNFYLNYLRYDAFSNWYWAIPVSLCVFWFYPDRRLARATGFCLLMAVGMLMVISCAQTKIWWYVVPAIPLFAVVTGVLIDQIAGVACYLFPLNKQLFAVTFLIIFSIQPSYEAFYAIQHLKDDLSKDNNYAPSYYFRMACNGKKELRNYIYICGGYDIHWRLQVLMLNEKGMNISCVPVWDNPKLKANDKVVANLPESKTYIETNYKYQLADDFYGVRNYIITGRK